MYAAVLTAAILITLIAPIFTYLLTSSRYLDKNRRELAVMADEHRSELNRLLAQFREEREQCLQADEARRREMGRQQRFRSIEDRLKAVEKRLSDEAGA